MPIWLIPIAVKIASRLIDYAFDQTEKQCPKVKEDVYNKVMKKDKKAYDKMKGNDHV